MNYRTNVLMQDIPLANVSIICLRIFVY